MLCSEGEDPLERIGLRVNIGTWCQARRVGISRCLPRIRGVEANNTAALDITATAPCDIHIIHPLIPVSCLLGTRAGRVGASVV